MTPPTVSAWAVWALATGVIACAWIYGSEALAWMARRANRRHVTHLADVEVDPDMAAWQRIVAALEEDR